MIKICNTCKQEKSLSEYTKDKETRDGFSNRCRECKLIKDSIYREKNRAQLNLRSRERRAADPEKFNQLAKARREKDIERYRLYERNYRLAHPEKVKAARKKQAPIFKFYMAKFRSTLKGRFGAWKSSAIKRNIAWEIELQDVEHLPQICYYTKQVLTFETNRPNSISLDRLDSSKPYTKTNVVFCCELINRMKWEFSEQEFLETCNKIAQNYGKPPQVPAQSDSFQFPSPERLTTRFSNCKSRAKRTGREFSLDYAEISSRPFNCWYSGAPLTCQAKKLNTVSFDRLDSKQGYTTENTVLCTGPINLMKQEMTEQDFIETCRLIANTFSTNPPE